LYKLKIVHPGVLANSQPTF